MKLKQRKISCEKVGINYLISFMISLGLILINKKHLSEKWVMHGQNERKPIL